MAQDTGEPINRQMIGSYLSEFMWHNGIAGMMKEQDLFKAILKNISKFKDTSDLIDHIIDARKLIFSC